MIGKKEDVDKLYEIAKDLLNSNRLENRHELQSKISAAIAIMLTYKYLNYPTINEAINISADDNRSMDFYNPFAKRQPSGSKEAFTRHARSAAGRIKDAAEYLSRDVNWLDDLTKK